MIKDSIFARELNDAQYVLNYLKQKHFRAQKNLMMDNYMYTHILYDLIPRIGHPISKYLLDLLKLDSNCILFKNPHKYEYLDGYIL